MQDYRVIIQKYIPSPLLVKDRKFDVKVFALLTSVNGIHKGYVFNRGYCKLAQKAYSKFNLEFQVGIE